MTLVFLRVSEQVAVKLLDVVFRQGNVRITSVDKLHGFGISPYLLLVPAREGSALDV